MNKLTVTINESYVRKDGQCSVYIFTTLNSEPVRLPVNVRVRPDKWNKKASRIKGSTQDVKDLNMVISNCVKRVTDIFVRYRLQDRELTPNILKKEYETPSVYIDFITFMEKTINDRKKILNYNTIKSQCSVLKKLKEFKKPIMFSELDENFINDYKQHIRSKLKNGPATIEKNMKVIKCYINLARRENKEIVSPFESIKIQETKSNREYLESDELKKLIAIYKSNRLADNLHLVLRHFLFCCFTGLRISDFKRCKKDDVINNMLVMVPVKTKKFGKQIKVPLTDTALQLIADEDSNTAHLFKSYTEQVMNRYLKRIMTNAGIKKNITMHCARHTFATMFLQKTKNIAALQKLLGHSKITETMIYAHVLTDDLEKEMQKFDRGIF
jgi:integrase